MVARGSMSAPGWVVGFALVAIFAAPARGAVGDLDLSFGGTGIVIAPATPTPAFATAADILIDDQDRILIVGFTYVPGGADVALLRILPDGTLDPSFGTNGRVVTSLSPGVDFVAAARFDAQGRIVVATYSSAAQGGTDLAVARFLPSGVLDPTFSDDGWNSAPLGTEQEFASDLAIDADGRIVIVGTTIEGDGYSDILLARFTDDGRLDETFGDAGLVRTDVGGGADHAGGVAIDGSGRIVLAGYACGWSCSMAVLRYRPDGTLDPAFGGGGVVTSDPATGSSGASAVVLDALGRITVSGSAQGASGQSLVAARYLDDGRLDPSFSGDGITSWSTGVGDTSGIELAIDDAGRVLVTGSTGLRLFDHSLVLTRFLADGRLDASFDDDGSVVTAIPGVDALAIAVAVDRSGRVLVVGEGEVALGDRRFVVARHQATSATERGDVLVLDDTTTDTGIVLRVSPSTGAFSILSDRGLLWDACDIAVTPGGRILVATLSSVVEVDATSGAQRRVASGGDIRSAVALAAEDAASFVVLDASAKVVRVATSTGAQTLLSSGGLLVEPRDVAIAADGAILVLDGASGGAIVRVERVDGAQSVIASGGALATARALVAQPDGTALVLAG
ncbi:hypothetical protein K2Z84_03760, partial [Candidatus Binatia bacterium]|nr:hypothetical protein [Candidatus Binatia bacterium]